jgi:hypothetical protein
MVECGRVPVSKQAMPEDDEPFAKGWRQKIDGPVVHSGLRLAFGKEKGTAMSLTLASPLVEDVVRDCTRGIKIPFVGHRYAAP